MVQQENIFYQKNNYGVTSSGHVSLPPQQMVRQKAYSVTRTKMLGHISSDNESTSLNF